MLPRCKASRKVEWIYIIPDIEISGARFIKKIIRSNQITITAWNLQEATYKNSCQLYSLSADDKNGDHAFWGNHAILMSFIYNDLSINARIVRIAF